MCQIMTPGDDALQWAVYERWKMGNRGFFCNASRISKMSFCNLNRVCVCVSTLPDASNPSLWGERLFLLQIFLSFFFLTLSFTSPCIFPQGFINIWMVLMNALIYLFILKKKIDYRASKKNFDKLINIWHPHREEPNRKHVPIHLYQIKKEQLISSSVWLSTANIAALCHNKKWVVCLSQCN